MVRPHSSPECDGEAGGKGERVKSKEFIVRSSRLVQVKQLSRLGACLCITIRVRALRGCCVGVTGRYNCNLK